MVIKKIWEIFNVHCGETRGSCFNVLVLVYSFMNCCTTNDNLDNPWSISVNLKDCSALGAKAVLFSGSIKDQDFVVFF